MKKKRELEIEYTLEESKERGGLALNSIAYCLMRGEIRDLEEMKRSKLRIMEMAHKEEVKDELKEEYNTIEGSLQLHNQVAGRLFGQMLECCEPSLEEEENES